MTQRKQGQDAGDISVGCLSLRIGHAKAVVRLVPGLDRVEIKLIKLRFNLDKNEKEFKAKFG
jgi:hypothetical protein